MIGKHPITYNGTNVGYAEVSRAGLYYRIRCTCLLEGSKIYRILLSNINLGVLVPDSGSFVLNTKRPVKQFADISPNFCVTDGNDGWQPVYSQRPFLHLQELDSAVLQTREGITGIQFKNPASAPQDSDRNL